MGSVQFSSQFEIEITGILTFLQYRSRILQKVFNKGQSFYSTKREAVRSTVILDKFPIQNQIIIAHISTGYSVVEIGDLINQAVLGGNSQRQSPFIVCVLSYYTYNNHSQLTLAPSIRVYRSVRIWCVELKLPIKKFRGIQLSIHRLCLKYKTRSKN